ARFVHRSCGSERCVSASMMCKPAIRSLLSTLVRASSVIVIDPPLCRWRKPRRLRHRGLVSAHEVTGKGAGVLAVVERQLAGADGGHIALDVLEQAPAAGWQVEA